MNVPGGDLILWADELKQKRDAPWWSIAPGGRAASSARRRLRRLGLTNVRALKNGTMGWVLAGLELETKPQRKTMAAPSVKSG